MCKISINEFKERNIRIEVYLIHILSLEIYMNKRKQISKYIINVIKNKVHKIKK